MTCYAVPATAFLIHNVLRKKNPSWINDKYHSTLSKLLLGGAAFGVVDHIWNGELFASNNILMDLLLGVTITAVIFMIAGAYMVVDKLKEKHAQKAV